MEDSAEQFKTKRRFDGVLEVKEEPVDPDFMDTDQNSSMDTSVAYDLDDSLNVSTCIYIY